MILIWRYSLIIYTIAVKIEWAEEPLRSHYSRMCLLDVKYYSLFDGGLPHDMMHDVLERTAFLEIKLLIVHCISSK